MTFNDRLVPPPQYREEFRRTRTVWSERGHQSLARLRVGIVGLGSVGMAVAEHLARMGVERVTVIDFDEVQQHNVDRLQGCHVSRDVGRRKVDVAADLIARAATAAVVDLRRVPASVVEEAGYRAALDCDVLFGCVDRPRARQILNHIAFAHLIPVIDGGIAVRFREPTAAGYEFAGAEWQAQTVGPDLPCLECVGAFTRDDAETERAGMLDDPRYMHGLPADHRLRQSENVYPFSTSLAALEVLQYVGLTAGLRRVAAFGPQRAHFVAGVVELDRSSACRAGCDVGDVLATGDRLFTLTGVDLAADAARARQAAKGGNWEGGRSFPLKNQE